MGKHRKQKNTESKGKKVVTALSVTDGLDELIADMKNQVAEIVAAYEASGEPYTDEEFTADMTSIYKDPDNPTEDITAPDQWRRITEICDAPKLFKGGSAPGDVIQGGCGTCYFLGALSVIACNKGMLEQLFVAHNVEAGVYAIRFFKEGEWTSVVIDDYIPCDEEGTPVYATCKDPNEVWVGLIEKAYAKLNGSYQAIDGGMTGYALSELTGGAVFPYITDAVEEKFTWEKLTTGMARGSLFAASFSGGREVDSGEGILSGHAYGVLRTAEYKGNRLVLVRNPWGQTEWTGAWSDTSDNWDAEALQALNHRLGDDGSFWMEFGDFVSRFREIEECRLFDSETHLATSWLYQDPEHAPEDHYLAFHLENAAEVTFSVRTMQYPPEAEDLDGDGVEDWEPVEIESMNVRLVYNSAEDELVTDGEVVVEGDTDGSYEEYSAMVQLKPGYYSILVNIVADKTPGYVVRVYSREPVTLEEYAPPEDDEGDDAEEGEGDAEEGDEDAEEGEQ